MDDRERIRRSALWAAYGDALGFITELADEKSVKWRVGRERIQRTMNWRRRVGGKYGVEVEIPAGCYSDDTQLRLSTARAIRGDGVFDVEAFAKVELPVWTSYALGAGRGTRTAAHGLAKQNANWFSNFFEQRGIRYSDAGGNGAAMRIQPHVWACKRRDDPAMFLPDVIRNTITTHGHPLALGGAIFHSLCLAWALNNRRVPDINYWWDAAEQLAKVPFLMRDNGPLEVFWLRRWEEEVTKSVEEIFRQLRLEIRHSCEIARRYANEEPETAYRKFVDSIGGLKPETRGSGLDTSISAAFLAWCFREEDLEDAMIVATNLLCSDTDTISTMAGAILGAVAGSEPSGTLLDREYIASSADRLWRLSTGSREESFPYPDLLKWKAPRSQVDAVGKVGDAIGLAGLGIARPISGEMPEQRRGGAVWQWLRMDFGQTILSKRRPNMKQIPPECRARHDGKIGGLSAGRSSDLFDPGSIERPRNRPRTLDELTAEAIRQGFDPHTIGCHLLEILDGEESIEKAIGYAAILGKARVARKVHKKR